MCLSHTYEIIFYVDAKGNSPVGEWLSSLVQNAKKRSFQIQLKQFETCSKLLEQYGTYAPKDKVAHIGDSIWEIRPGNNRVFLFTWKDKKIVLLHQYGPKQTRKAPTREILKAKHRRDDWIERYGK